MEARVDRRGRRSRRVRRGALRFLRWIGAVALAAALGCSSTIRPFESAPPGEEVMDEGVAAMLAGALGEQIRAQGAPGIQLSLRVGEEVYHLAAGSADSRRRVPLRTGHVLRVGSVTKLLTAALILRLAEGGALSLDDTVERWFPLLPHAEGITLRRLLNHTSGVFDYTQDRTFRLTTTLFSGKRWEPQELYRLVLRGEPSFAPGERHLYSNSNYLLLGLVAERVSGRVFADLLQEGILDPAGMAHTYLLPAEETPAALISGYDRDLLPGDLTRIRPRNRAWASGAFSAGGVAATSSDLLALIDALFYGQLLSAESLEQMADFVPAPDQDHPAQTGYGLGLRRFELEGDVLVGHTGTIPGFGAVVVHCAQKDYSIAALANLSAFDQSGLLRALIRLVQALP